LGDDAHGNLALVLTGGGARAAYQVGVLVGLARRFPDLRIPILVGVSAGAVNAVHLASYQGPFAASVADLAGLWRGLTIDRIFRVDAPALVQNVLRWGTRLLSGGSRGRVLSLLDTAPLRRLMQGHFATDGVFQGIGENVRRGVLEAVAISGVSYSTGQSTVWTEGSRDIPPWTRPRRCGVPTVLTVDHVMASAALPPFFPAVRIEGDWYGDGGIRLATPLSPAIHLGASRILVIATQGTSLAEEGLPAIAGYPPPAQVLGLLFDSVFLDALDEDTLRLRRLNRLIEKLPEEERGGLRTVDLRVLRPSQDLAGLAEDYERRLPRAFRFLSRGLGTREATRADMLSLLLFEPDYVRRLMEIGEGDAEEQGDEVAAFLAGNLRSVRGRPPVSAGTQHAVGTHEAVRATRVPITACAVGRRRLHDTGRARVQGTRAS
jgi:NTE family protein